MTFLSRIIHLEKKHLSRLLIIGYMILAFFPVIFSVDLASAMEVTVTWQANDEVNLVGYYIYYDTSPAPPYLGADADQGASPITVMIEDLEDPENPEYTITGLDDDEVYYVALTAFDRETQESDFSNEASTADTIETQESDFPNEASTADTTSAYPTFDGSEGCFIGVATNGVHAVGGISAVILLLLPGVIGLTLVRAYLRFLKNQTSNP